MTFLGSDVIALLEQVLPETLRRRPGRLPARRSGSRTASREWRSSSAPGRRAGRARLSSATVTSFLRSRGRPQRLMVDVWEQSGTLRVERREPYVTAGAKTPSVHVLQELAAGARRLDRQNERSQIRSNSGTDSTMSPASQKSTRLSDCSFVNGFGDARPVADAAVVLVHPARVVGARLEDRVASPGELASPAGGLVERLVAYEQSRDRLPEERPVRLQVALGDDDRLNGGEGDEVPGADAERGSLLLTHEADEVDVVEPRCVEGPRRRGRRRGSATPERRSAGHRRTPARLSTTFEKACVSVPGVW